MIEILRNPSVYTPPVVPLGAPTIPCRVGTVIYPGNGTVWSCLDQNMKIFFQRYHGCYGGWSRGVITWDRDLGITAFLNQSTQSGAAFINAFTLRIRQNCNNQRFMTFNKDTNQIFWSYGTMYFRIEEITVQ